VYFTATFNDSYENDSDNCINFYGYSDSGYIKIFWGDGTSSIETSGSYVIKQATGAGEYVCAFHACDSDGSFFDGLTEFYIDNSKLTYLNLTNANNITSFSAYNNQLTEIDITNHQYLNNFNLTNNNLTTFDLTGCPNLNFVFIYSNEITSINAAGVTGSGGKFYIDASYNLMEASNLNNFYTSLGIAAGIKNYVAVYNNPGIYDDNKFIAINKGWYVNGTDTNSINFVSNKTTGTIDLTIKTGTGYCKITWWDDTEEVLGVGDENTPIVFTKSADLSINKFIIFKSTDVNGNESNNIKDVDLSNNGITFIDFGGSYDMRGINLQNNLISNFYLHGNNGLTDLNVQGCNQLYDFYLTYSPYVTDIVGFSGLTNLKKIYINNVAVPSYDLSPFTGLTSCTISNSITENIQVANMNNLKHFESTNNSNIHSFNFTNCPDLESIQLYNNNNLSNLVFNSINSIKYLDIGNTAVSSLTTNFLTQVETLNLDYCSQLHSVDLSPTQNLKLFNGYNCLFTNLIFSGLSHLTNVQVNACNYLSDLIVSDCPNVQYVQSQQSAVANVTLTNLPKLDELSMRYNSNMITWTVSNLGTPSNVSLYYGVLSTQSLNDFYNAIGDRSSVYQGYINIYANPNVNSSDYTIAENKNYYVQR